MKKDILVRLCDKFYILSEYPVALFDKNKLMYSCGYKLGDSELPGLMRNFFKQDAGYGDFQYVWEKQAILAIYFPVFNTDVSIMVGPLLTVHMKEDEIRKLLQEQKTVMSESARKMIAEYFMKIRPIKTDAVFDYSEFFYMAVNQSVPDPEQPLEENGKEITVKERIDGRPIERMEVFYSEENTRYVEKLSYVIQNGLIEELEKFIANEHEFPYGKLGPNVLRHQKNSCIISVYIVRKAAQAGGLDESISLRLAEEYTQRFELARSSMEVYQLSKDMMRDYCRRVRKLNRLHVSSPVIAQTVKYIHDHRMEKINAHIVAKTAGLSYSYLCSQFKKETGTGITSFIQQEKIDAAKELLLFSDLSLGEIAEYLSFSSQSYFQTIFKKREQCTPMEYRQRRECRSD